MRIIDADALKLMVQCPFVQDIDDVLAVINDAETVDAVPVVHARWEIVDEAEPQRYGCSKCSCLSWYGMYNYCPNCGAKMDLEGLNAEKED